MDTNKSLLHISLNKDINRIISEWANEAGIKAAYKFELPNKITIYTEHPGILIGSHGYLEDRYVNKISRYLMEPVKITFVEISGIVSNIN